MLIFGVWWAGIILELLLLLRGVRGKFFLRLPVFFSYILFVLTQSVLLYAVYHWAPQQYGTGYWICQFLAILIGSAVVFEIYRVALHSYPGTSRMARNALFFVFALTIAKVLVYQSNGTLSWLISAPAELERNLRVVQAFAILAIVCVLLLYAIPCNRNLKGILLGYGLFVGSSVFELSLLSHFGDSFKTVWAYMHTFSYLFFLMIWLVALWSPASEPLPKPVENVPESYSELTSDTQAELSKLRLGFRKAAR
jgi:hypothetical protein